jgi:hypothetical protein
MSKIIQFFKKFALAALVLAIGLTSLPALGASGVVPVSAQGAAGLQDQTTPSANQSTNGIVPVSARDNTRLEQIWARSQTAYQRQGNRLAKAEEFLTRAQSLIDKANQKGWDTSAIQVALDAFAAVIPAAQAAHAPGAAIIADHNGFNPNGKVIDRAAAIETVKTLVQVLKNTRLAMNGTGQALREAVKAFRADHKPTQSPITP